MRLTLRLTLVTLRLNARQRSVRSFSSRWIVLLLGALSFRRSLAASLPIQESAAGAEPSSVPPIAM